MITYPNLYHLKYFADAVELGSISEAAKKNLVTHPAISRAIAVLERHLGVELLKHQRKHFVVTEMGNKVAMQARLFLAAAVDFNSLGIKPQIEEAKTLRIGVSRTLAEVYLTNLLKTIKTKFANASVQVRFGTTNEITEAAAKNAIDLGITIGSQNLATLRQSVIRSGKFMLVESASSANAREGFELKSFILTEPRTETEILKREYQKEYGRILPVHFEISSWEVIGQLVRQGLGVGLLPDLAIKNWKKGTFRLFKPHWFESEFEVYVHTAKNTSQNSVLRFALDYLMITK